MKSVIVKIGLAIVVAWSAFTYCAIAAEDTPLSNAPPNITIKNPSTGSVFVRITGPTPHEALIPPLESKTCALKAGIYRVYVRLGSTGEYNYMEGPFFPVGNYQIGQSMQLMQFLTLPDPNKPTRSWRRIEENGFPAPNTTRSLAADGSIEKLLQLVTVETPGTMQGGNEGILAFLGGPAGTVVIGISFAVDEIKDSSTRSRAIRELGGMADANAKCDDAIERQVVLWALLALSYFQDRPTEVEPILSRYFTHQDNSIAARAKEYLAKMSNEEKK